MNFRIFRYTALFSLIIAISVSCNKKESFYSVSDFAKVSKIDAHFHYLTMNDQYIKFAVSEKFKLLTPIWEGEEVPIDTQFRISGNIKKLYPENYIFFAAFPTDSFNIPGFADRTIDHIRKSLKNGASGIKIWKNIGMVLKDKNGRYVMIDDPAFEPIFKYLEENKIPVMGHLGEPKDCWLPENEMIDPGAVRYFKDNPEYYMFLHPEAPSYMDQINARDNVLKKHPGLNFIGAHLASLEWSVDELAKRLDSYPNLKVDMAARMYPIQYQANLDREKVRNFMIKYQDRILYGTDAEVHDDPAHNVSEILEGLHRVWLNQWIYMTTDSTVEFKGLKLPKEVIDKIYYRNAEQYFGKY